MASKLNPPSTIVTRRKKRDLEATMKSLKKLLEPSSGSRKKSIPRSISKKIPPKKTRSINRFESYENSSEDGEYYPNKLKRKDIAKKIVLKPKHELKVVIATNKRKRGTPHKGVKSREEKLIVLNETSEELSNTLPKLSTETGTKSPIYRHSNLKQVSPHRDMTKSPLSVRPSTNIRKYELVSPPHRSLTELTVDDLMRMDADSLSEDDLMEVLTCPSPVWWEDPPDYFNEGVLYLGKTGDLDVHNEAEEQTADNTKIINSTSNTTGTKRTETAGETKKYKKMAKLENILGNIKNRVRNKPEDNVKVTDKEITNDKSKDDNVKNDKGNVANRTYDNDQMNQHFKETSQGNALKNNENDETNDKDSSYGVNDEKLRKISSSGSEMSVNDEDLLRNLENIDIPIHNADTGCTKDENDEGSQSSKDNDSKPKAVKKVKDLECQTTNSADKTVAKPSTADIDFNKEIVIPEKHKDILNRLRNQTDDILDKTLVKIPTNARNDVKMWSKVENFQRHSLKPGDSNDVIDVENELMFSVIKCNNQIDSETICIEDDDDEQIKEAIDLDAIGKVNEKVDSNLTDLAEITPLNADKNLIKEDTITISKDKSQVRVVDTFVCVDEIIKPELITQAVVKEKEAPKLPKNESNKEIRGIRILPMNMISKVPNSKTNTKNKKRTKKLIQQYVEEKTNGKTKGVKIMNSRNEKVIRINDLDISIIKRNDHNAGRKVTPEVKNDVCITLVSNDNKSGIETNKRIEVPSKTAVILPPLTRNVSSGNRNDKAKEANQKRAKTPVALPSLKKKPNKFQSPKSINSISSETTDGTISDTNIQFLDEYDDDKRSVHIVFEGETIDDKNTDNEIKSQERMTSSAGMCVDKQVSDNAEKRNISKKSIKRNRNKKK